MAYLLNNISLGDDPLWLNKLEWTPRFQTEKHTIGGGMALYSHPKGGRDITLTTWLTYGILLHQLTPLRNSGDSMILTWDTEAYSVRFRYSDGNPLLYQPLIGEYTVPIDSDLHFVTLKLIEV